VGVQIKLWNPREHVPWTLLQWWFTTKRRYIKCMHAPLPFTLGRWTCNQQVAGSTPGHRIAQ